MPKSDIFALKDSSLNAFLFADVGIEANGSGLTILSMLARLDKNPWAEAALWAQQPPATAIDSLVVSLGRMPLSHSSLQDARATASRLVGLLPKQSPSVGKSAGSRAGTLATPNWGYILFVYLGLYLALDLGMAPAPNPKTTVTAPTEQSAGHSR